MYLRLGSFQFWGFIDRLYGIDRRVYRSVILRRPVHLSMHSLISFNQSSTQYSFQATGFFHT